MKQIKTVTLNPSLDRTITVHYLNLGYQNRSVGDTHLYPAGRAMNIAEGLASLAIPVEAIVMLGDCPNSTAYESLLQARDFSIHIARFSGTIRSNLFVIDTGNNHETIIKETGGTVSASEMNLVDDLVLNGISSQTIVVLAGSLPDGADEDAASQLIRQIKAVGGQVFLHTDSEFLAQALSADPDIVAINQLQAESYFNFPVRVESDVIYCAEQLLAQGAKLALVALADHQGVIGMSATERFKVEYDPPARNVEAFSGSFSAFIAGFLSAIAQEQPLKDALITGWSSASYTAEHVGNEFGNPDGIAEYKAAMTVEDLTVVDE